MTELKRICVFVCSEKTRDLEGQSENFLAQGKREGDEKLLFWERGVYVGRRVW